MHRSHITPSHSLLGSIVTNVTAAKLKKVEFDQDSKMQVLRQAVCQIKHNQEADEEAEGFRIGCMVSTTSMEGWNHAGSSHTGQCQT